jgi:hypothetical protein
MTGNRNRSKLAEFGHVYEWSMEDAICKYDGQGKGRIRRKEVLRKVSDVPRNFVRGGRCSTNSVEDRGQRERGSGGGPVRSGAPLNLQMSETHILVRLLWLYFPRNWEFGSALSKLRNFCGVGLNPPSPPPLLVCHWERFCTGIAIKYTGMWETEMEWIEARVQAT